MIGSTFGMDHAGDRFEKGSEILLLYCYISLRLIHCLYPYHLLGFRFYTPFVCPEERTADTMGESHSFFHLTANVDIVSNEMTRNFRLPRATFTFRSLSRRLLLYKYDSCCLPYYQPLCSPVQAKRRSS